MKILETFLIGCIRLYQKILSPNHNIFGIKPRHLGCRFYPSCSEYAIEALRQYGLLKGTIASWKRIARCNPFSEGGYDPLIPKHGEHRI